MNQLLIKTNIILNRTNEILRFTSNAVCNDKMRQSKYDASAQRYPQQMNMTFEFTLQKKKEGRTKRKTDTRF